MNPALRDAQHDKDNVVETLELMADEKFMKSYRQARAEVARRDFADWKTLSANK